MQQNNEATAEENVKQERDVTDRRLMELKDNITEARFKLLAFLLEQLDNKELSRYEVFKFLKDATQFDSILTKNYIVILGNRQHEAVTWESLASQFDTKKF